MHRRNFIQSASLLLASKWATPAWAATDVALRPSSKRTVALTNFERMKVGVSFHFGMNTFTGNDDDTGTAPATLYAPRQLNVDQWLATAAVIGARYAVLTAQHMSGFCLWDADDYDYDVAASGNHTDVVAAFMTGCQKRNIMPGLYYCILDPRNEGNREREAEWAGRVSASYFRFVLRQIAELHRKYKGIGLQVIDIPGKLSMEERWEIYRTVKILNPDCLLMMNQTWTISRANRGRIAAPGSWPTDIMLSEDTLPPVEGHDPWVVYRGDRYYMPMACWIPSGPFYNTKYREWFWGPHFKTRPAADLFALYRKTVSRNASYMLNLSPDTRGLLPDEEVMQVHRLAELMRVPHPEKEKGIS